MANIEILSEAPNSVVATTGLPMPAVVSEDAPRVIVVKL